MTDLTAISLALSDQPTLQEAVTLAITESPQHALLFTSLAQYINLLKSQIPLVPLANVPLRPGESTVPKKRRIDEAGADVHTAPTNGAAKAVAAGSNGAPTDEIWRSENAELVLGVPDISFTVPVRKKLTLELVKGGLRTRIPGGGVEFGIAWKDIAHIQLLPIPEKPTRQYALTVFLSSANAEVIVLTLTDTVPKNISPASAMPSDSSTTTYSTLLLMHLSALLPPPIKVIEPSSEIFVSGVPQPHRPKEAAFHVKAFRGSKDGYLFFLSTGILWGFKKPLLFLPVDRIIRVAYTSILQRTFNLVVTYEKPGAEGGSSSNSAGADAEVEEEDVEFSMIDQKDFEGIDKYVKTRGLEDGSLAVERRAKALHINGKPTADAEGAGPGESGAGETELEKAAREMEMQRQDEEDEEEEDYDPGSEGESEGEGSSSEEEEADGQEEMEEAEEEDDEAKA